MHTADDPPPPSVPRPPGGAFPVSDHCDGTLFFNPGVDTDKSVSDILRWRRSAQRTAWPERVANRSYPPPPERVGPGTVALTFIGHATMLARFAGGTVLFDPLFSLRASPLPFAGPKRVRAPGLALDALPDIDAVLVSHNHYDHMDIASLRALKRRGAGRIVTGLGNDLFLAGKGLPGATALDWWERVSLAPGFTVTFTPAQHWSSRRLSDRRRTLWGGFLVETGAGSLYYAGDTGYCPWFEAIGARLGAPGLAILPIGAYAPRWFMRNQHMDPAEAVQAHRDLGARRSVGMHFGTIQLTDEGIEEPVHKLETARAAAGLAPETFVTLDIGETRLFVL